MIRRIIKRRAPNKRAVRRYTLMFTIKFLIGVFSIPACAQIPANQGWPILEAGLAQKDAGQRLAAVRALGLIPNDTHAAELAENALRTRTAQSARQQLQH